MYGGLTTHGAEIGIKKLKEKYEKVRMVKDEAETHKKLLKEREVDTVIDN